MASTAEELYKINVPVCIDYLQVNTVIRIQIAHVYDPSKFWMKIFYNDIDKWNETLSAFYRSYTVGIHPEVLKDGLTCMIRIGHTFYRVDMGTFHDVPVKNLCYIFHPHAELPRLALRARLHDAAPKKTLIWKRVDRDIMLDLIEGQVLSATVMEIDTRHQVLELAISVYSNCTPTANDLRTLIMEYGRVDSVEKYDQFVHPCRYQWIDNHPFCYPTMAAIENGQYPCTIDGMLSNPFIIPPYLQWAVSAKRKRQEVKSHRSQESKKNKYVK